MKNSHYFSRLPSSPYKVKKMRVVLRGHTLELYTAPGVFSANRIDLGTKYLCRVMKIPMHGKILDFGTGIGIVAIVAAKESPDALIYATDINPRATQLARRNVELNNLQNVKVLNVEGFGFFDSEMFSAIISNPPYSAGWSVIKDMITQGLKHLHQGGTMQLVCLQRKGGRRVKETLLQIFGNVEVLARRSGYRVFLSSK
ncbi:MAG: class I SAM-dependent methyltransferase [Candidatus Heimdallarchaeota archaeon]